MDVNEGRGMLKAVAHRRSPRFDRSRDLSRGLNDSGNPAAAKNRRLHDRPDPPLGFTAWLRTFRHH